MKILFSGITEFINFKSYYSSRRGSGRRWWLQYRRALQIYIVRKQFLFMVCIYFWPFKYSIYSLPTRSPIKHITFFYVNIHTWWIRSHYPLIRYQSIFESTEQLVNLFSILPSRFSVYSNIKNKNILTTFYWDISLYLKHI